MKHFVLKYCLFHSSEHRFMSHADSNVVAYIYISNLAGCQWQEEICVPPSALP